MAELAVALLPFAVERLWNLLVRETKQFQGVGEQFEGLKNDVDTLRCFLKDAEAKKHANETVRKIIKDINEIVFDAEDIIETFLLKKTLRESSSSSVRRFASVTVRTMVLGFDMKPIRNRISKVIRDMQSFGVLQNEERMQSLEVRERQKRETFSIDDQEKSIVGMERNIEILVGYLVEEGSSQVVSITGMGGLGKTTLARKVFNHETIKSHFREGLAWVCVSQQFERKSVWETILQQLRSECYKSKMKENELLEKIVGVFETQKALIVIDDIWREEDWDLIKPVFLPNKGWKVLFTSRNEEVALHADRQCVTFKPECLTSEESWDLFQRIAFPIKDTVEFKIDEVNMKEIGMEMLKHCGGLPLAIKVLGGMLRKKYTLHQWKVIHENIKAPIVRGTGFDDGNMKREVYNVLYLSFEELPAYLKHCFLYLASFPEDFKIDVEKLSYYWAAEGILRPMDFDGASIREVGDGYIEDLVKRHMIISERDVKTFRFETLQLHDMMREVCLRKAEEENFVQTIGTSTANSKSPCKSRRLAIVSSPKETFNVDKEVKNPSLRTLLLFFESGSWMKISFLFTRHKLMRVLDLSYVEFEGGKVPSNIGKLIHLRYLSFKGSYVTQLPSSMRNLKKLLYLNLGLTFLLVRVYMPNVLNEMRELTFLLLPKFLKDETKLELGNLVKLETLKNFNTKHGRVTDLQGMTRLRSLSIFFVTDERYTMETLSSSLSKLSHLESLTIDSLVYTPTNDDEEGFVWDFVNLKQLNLELYMPRLPDAQHFPSHLTTISLKWCRLKEDPMPILEKLLHLQVIILGKRSFCGRRMDCSKDGLPRLQKLQFEGLEEWEEWIVEEGSMPLLHSLKIKSCRKLKELPDRLRFITNLEDLSIKNMGDEFKLKGYLPYHLTTIHIKECCLKEDPMPILEKLLHLKEVRLESKSFCGRRMVCSRNGFTQLQKLRFYELDEWEEWIIEEGSMPLLHTLDIYDCKKLKELPDRLRFITSLKDLSVNYLSSRFWDIFSSTSRLTTIHLNESCLEENPIPILEKLLHLKHMYLGERSFHGRRIVCSRGGFPQLQTLFFWGLNQWEEWIVEEGSMPLLHSLEIYCCPKLKELPDGLRFITSLKSLTCYYMGKEWKKRLSEGGKDYYKVQHIPSVTIK
ncbi:probable disease resistance protein At1g59620 [Raphanus sativus]|uniref:Probable disease resistance protein At1g59620 n=1 Tax=Raphanus sativus TaxID=3726 RepID=A0A6J0JXW4_RAPSA|nr:probable disease resistance protein At1g59620 [Raphanus sativus]